jgi:hypothetical protein
VTPLASRMPRSEQGPGIVPGPCRVRPAAVRHPPVVANVVGTLFDVKVERALRPFWMHQTVEYVIGIVLIALAFQSPRPTLPSVMGLLVLINAAITIGPAGAFRLVPRGVHRWLDVGVMAILVAAGIQPWVSVDATGRLLILLIALVMFAVWFHTDFATRQQRTARREARARPDAEERGRRAGRMLGEAVNSVKRWRNDA